MDSTTLATNRVSLQPFDQLIRASWNFFKQNAQKLLLISLIIMGPSILNEILRLIFGNQPNPVIVLVMLILGLLSAVAGVWGTVALITFIKANQPAMTIESAFNSSAHLFWSYFLTSLLVGLIVLGGFILLIVPGIIWMISYSFYTYVLVDKNLPAGYEAARQSKALVRGYWWPVFGRIFILGLIYLALNVILLPLKLISVDLFTLSMLIIGLGFSVFSSIYCFWLYQNLKQIKANQSNITPINQQ